MGTIHRLDKKAKLLDPTNSALQGQQRVNAEIFIAVEILGRKLERVEAERDMLAARLAVIETAASVDERTGKIYLPVALDTPERDGAPEASSKWMLAAVALTGLIALAALSVAVFRPTPATLTTEQAAMLDSLKAVPVASAAEIQANEQPADVPLVAPDATQAAATEESVQVETPVETSAATPTEPVAPEVEKKPQPVAETMQKDANLSVELQPLESRAMEGSGEAQHDLGAIYAAGDATKQDYALARQWFERAAASGIGNAHYNLGVLYQQGLGVAIDMKRAVTWYESAAKLNHPDAMYNLGIAYAEGTGVAADMPRAIGYFKQAAELGVSQAAYNLGIVYESGMAGASDLAEARNWYQKAADAKHGGAEEALKRLTGKPEKPQAAKKPARHTLN